MYKPSCSYARTKCILVNTFVKCFLFKLSGWIMQMRNSLINVKSAAGHYEVFVPMAEHLGTLTSDVEFGQNEVE